MDASTSNAIVLHKLKFQEEYEKNKNRARRFCLETLALELIQPCIKWRIEMRQRNNFVGVQKDILNAIIKTGESIHSMIRPTANQSKLDKQKRCGICSGQNRLKSTTKCHKCDTVICSAKHTFAYCSNCNSKFNK